MSDKKVSDLPFGSQDDSENRLWDARRKTRHWTPFKLRQRRNPCDFFHKVRLTFDVRSPTWDMRLIAFHAEAKRGQ